MLAGRCLVLCPGEGPMCDDVFREDDVVPCGHIVLLWRTVVDLLELGPERVVILVKCRVL